jgi:hypothetical protein
MNSNDPIYIYNLCALRGAVKLEQKGLRRRGQSAKSLAINACGLKPRASYEEVLEALTKKIDDSVGFEGL